MELELGVGHGFHIFSKCHKLLFDEAISFKREGNVEVYYQGCYAFAILFSELLLLVVLLFSYSLIKFHSGFVLVGEWLTYTFWSKIFLHVEAEKKRKGIPTAINPLRKKDWMAFWNALKWKNLHMETWHLSKILSI